MDEKELTKALIRTLMFYGLLRHWEKEELLEAYKYLEIPVELVNETLNEGIDE